MRGWKNETENLFLFCFYFAFSTCVDGEKNDFFSLNFENELFSELLFETLRIGDDSLSFNTVLRVCPNLFSLQTKGCRQFEAKHLTKEDMQVLDVCQNEVPN